MPRSCVQRKHVHRRRLHTLRVATAGQGRRGRKQVCSCVWTLSERTDRSIDDRVFRAEALCATVRPSPPPSPLRPPLHPRPSLPPQDHQLSRPSARWPPSHGGAHCGGLERAVRRGCSGGAECCDAAFDHGRCCSNDAALCLPPVCFVITVRFSTARAPHTGGAECCDAAFDHGRFCSNDAALCLPPVCFATTSGSVLGCGLRFVATVFRASVRNARAQAHLCQGQTAATSNNNGGTGRAAEQGTGQRAVVMERGRDALEPSRQPIRTARAHSAMGCARPPDARPRVRSARARGIPTKRATPQAVFCVPISVRAIVLSLSLSLSLRAYSTVLFFAMSERGVQVDAANERGGSHFA